MATVAQLEQEISAAKAALGQLEADKGAALREIGTLNAEKDELTAAARKQYQGGDQAGASALRAQAAQLDTRIGNLYSSPAFKNLEAAESKLRTLESDLYAAKQKEEFNAKQNQPPTQTAAADVANSDAGATQNPAPPPTAAGRLTTTDAEKLAAKTESGTNPPVKTLTETQSVNNTSGLPVYAEDGSLATSRRNPETGELYTPLSEGRPGGEPGVGAQGEDGATASNTKQILDTVGNKPFQPRDNVLDQYASYTYNIGWYLMTPAQYKNLQTTAKPSIGQYNLLVQSGGAPENVGGVQPELTNGGTVADVTAAAGRNPFFGLDYYFDNLEIKSVISGKGTNRASNEASLKFTVTEPAGITLIDNLWKAVKGLYGDPKVGYAEGYYALVIRFYGYDKNGKIVQASNSDNSNAVVQKIIPFKIGNIEFSVTNRLVEYQVTGVAVPYDVGFGSNLGVIKSRIEVSGATVRDLLTKGVDPGPVSADDGRQTTPAAPGIRPGVGMSPVQADDTFNQSQADTLSLLAAGGLGA
jgi:hypothetical protein